MIEDLIIKNKLVLAHRIVASMRLDDHTYTHITIRPPKADYFYIAKFGILFEEVTIDDVLKVKISGSDDANKQDLYNITGYIIHGSIYNARSDVNAIIHLHTPEIVAVASIEAGLLPINQWAMHFYDSISYSEYDSLVMKQSASTKIIQELGKQNVMLLNNHGSITCGKDIEESLFYSYHLQQACKTQVMTLSMQKPVIHPNPEVLHKTHIDLMSFEQNIGHRDWAAWERKLKIQAF